MEAKQNDLTIKNEKFFYSKLKLKDLKLIKNDKIMFCKASDSYTQVYMVNGESFVLSQRIRIIEELLKSSIFVRCHKSYLVNINFVVNFSSQKPFCIMLCDGEKIIVSARKRKTAIYRILSNN